MLLTRLAPFQEPQEILVDPVIPGLSGDQANPVAPRPSTLNACGGSTRVSYYRVNLSQ